jgi:hypothetical protein
LHKRRKATTVKKKTTPNRTTVKNRLLKHAGANDGATTAFCIDTTKKVAALPAKPFDRPLDGYYKKTNILSAKVTPYANLREADVAFAKRVWREIDLREKMNQYLGRQSNG